MNIFFTSDTHFFHSNVIKYCNRPFRNHEEMNEKMIFNWNDTVRHDDIIYHLGDFSMNSRDNDINKKRKKNIREVLLRLNGKKILISGNHDEIFLDLYREMFSEVHRYKEIKVDDKFLVLCHYPIEEWNGSYDGHSIHLHGHSHGKCNKINNRFDVGVDCNNFYPVSLDEIKNKLKIIEETKEEI